MCPWRLYWPRALAPSSGLGDVAREHNSSARLSRKANRTQRRHLRFLLPLY